jgi:hypothetical protein
MTVWYDALLLLVTGLKSNGFISISDWLLGFRSITTNNIKCMITESSGKYGDASFFFTRIFSNPKIMKDIDVFSTWRMYGCRQMMLVRVIPMVDHSPLPLHDFSVNILPLTVRRSFVYRHFYSFNG